MRDCETHVVKQGSFELNNWQTSCMQDADEQRYSSQQLRWQHPLEDQPPHCIPTLHCTTLHYTVYYTTLYTTVHYTTLQCTLMYTTLHYNVCTLLYTPLHYTCWYFQHAHFIPIVGVGKRGAYSLVHGDLPRQHSFGTILRTTCPVTADSRQ